MRDPMLVLDTVGPYQAHVRRIDEAGTEIAGTATQVGFRSGWMAREWMAHHVVRSGDHHLYRAVITGRHSDPATTTLYEFTATGLDIAARLSLLGRLGLDEAAVTGTAVLPTEVASELLRRYSNTGAGIETDPHSEQRARVRRDIHTVAAEAAPLSQLSHLWLARGTLEIDAAAQSRPDGAFVAIYQPADIDGPQPDLVELPRRLRFDSPGQGREWLISQATDTLLRDQLADTRTIVRAALFDTDHQRVETSVSGPPARVAWTLHAHRDTDGPFLTGIDHVDNLRLNQDIEAYEQATDVLIQIINTNNGPSTGYEFEYAHERGHRLRHGIFGDIQTRVELAATEELDAAWRRVRAADVRLGAIHEIAPSTEVSSSGFLTADIQLGLRHLESLITHTLTTDPPTTARPTVEETGHRIAEVDARLDALLADPGVSGAERELVAAERTRIALEPGGRRIPLFTWPPLSMLIERTTELTSRTTLDERGVLDALRLHHLTGALAQDAAGTPAGYRRLVIGSLLSRQHDHLLRALERSGLDHGRYHALYEAISYDPLAPIPAQRSVLAPAARPAENLTAPGEDVILRHYLIEVADPAHPSRQWRIGLIGSRWVAYAHLPYPAYTRWRIEEGAVGFDTASELLTALATGITCLDHLHRPQPMPPVALPEPVRAALNAAQTIHDRQHSTATHPHTPPAPPEAVTPPRPRHTQLPPRPPNRSPRRGL